MTAYFRITVEDLDTGDKQVREFAEGDYVVTTLGDCYLDRVNTYSNGTVQLTIKNHLPLGSPREVRP